MTRFFIAFVVMASVVPTLAAAPVPAEDGKGVSFPFPAKAPIVVCLNGYDKARDRLSKLVAGALPDDAAHFTKLLDEQLNKFLEGRKLTGIRKNARAFLVVNDLSGILDNQLPTSILIPITSYKEFRETFLTKDELKSYDKGRDGVDSIKTSATGDETTVFVIDLKEYVALSTDKEVADAYAAKYAAGSTAPMGSEVADSFLKADVAVYVNMDAINDQFGDKIRGFRGFIDFGLQQAQQQGVLAGLNKKQLDALKIVLKGMFQGIEDCRAVVLAGEFQPEGLIVRLQARFAENTPSVKLIQSESSEAVKDIGKLPKGFGTYSESRLGNTLGKLFHELNQEFATTDDDEKGAAAIEQHLKDRSAAGPRGEWSATTTQGTTITVSNYKDSAKAIRATTNAYKAIAPGGRISSVIVKTTPLVSDEAEKYRGFTFSEVRIHFDFETTVASLPEDDKEVALESLKRAISEKTTIWIGTDGKVVITVSAKDWTSAKEILDKYLDGKQVVGNDQAFKATRDQLPTDATLLMVAETGSIVATLVDAVRAMAQAIPGAPRIGSVKPVKGAPTYVGFAVTLKGDTIGMTAFVPTGAIAVTRKIIDGLLKNFE